LIRVAIVDDHDLIRYGLVQLLNDVADFEVVAEGASGEDAIDIARNKQPHVILMDVKMPGIGGIEATRRIHSSRPEIGIIAVTACLDDPFPTTLLQNGAKGYITKGTATNVLVDAIRAVHRGQVYLQPEIAQQVAMKSVTGSKSPFDELSEREMQVALMIVNCHKVQDISDKLCLSPKTVNTYRYRIFEKLEVNSDVELTHLALRHGLADSDELQLNQV
jgi:DNA-binding NarL/FixJ family response regulator